MVQRVGAGLVLPAVLAGHVAFMAVGQGALYLPPLGLYQPVSKRPGGWVVCLGRVLDSKKAFLFKVVSGQAVGICKGLVGRVPLPEHRAQQPLVQLPQLGPGVTVAGGGQGGKCCVRGLLIGGVHSLH